MMPVAALAGLAPAMAFPLLGPIAEQLHVSLAAATWALTSTFLASAVSTPLVGRFSDLYGHRRVLVTALVITLAGSALIATTPSFVVLIVGRALQGVAAPLYPLAIAVLQRELGGWALSRSISSVTVVMAVGGGVGLVAAGIAGTGSDYRTVFWLPVVLCVVAIVAVVMGTRTAAAGTRGKVDVLGAVLLSASLVLVLLPLSRAARWGIGSPLVLGLVASGVVVGVAFVAVERRALDPILPGRLMRSSAVVVSTLTFMCVVSAVFVPMGAVPILVQAAPSIVATGPTTPLVTALVYLLPSAVVGSIGAPLAAWLVGRAGVRAALTTAGVLSVAGSAAMLLTPELPPALIGGLLVTTVALFISYAAIPLLLVTHVERSDLGAVNAVGSLGRWVASAVVTAATSFLLTQSPSGEPLGRADFRWTFLVGLAASVGVLITVILLPREERVPRSVVTRVAERG